jgi:hypothetical protein
MGHKILTKEQLTSKQFNTAFANSEIIQHWRKFPCEAVRDLLGIQLLDFQQYIFTKTWFSRDSAWLLTRNGSKTLRASVYALMVQLLYPEQEIWIVSKSGRQSKKLFGYLERLATNKINQFGELPDIYMQEVFKAQEAMTGFSHDPSGHSVKLINDSYIKTLNGIADNNRGECLPSQLVTFG